MKFYEITDDKYIVGRWVVDDPNANTDEIWDWHFTSGQRLGLKSVSIKIEKVGVALDFSMTVLQVPLLAKRLADAVRAVVAPADVEWIPAKVGKRSEAYEVMNALRLVECLDEKRSRSFERWTKDSIRPDLEGQYSTVIDMRIDPLRVPDGVHLFRVSGWDGPLIASETLINAMTQAPHYGMKTELVS